MPTDRRNLPKWMLIYRAGGCRRVLLGCRPEGNALKTANAQADARMLSAFIEKMVHSSNAAGETLPV